MNDLPPPPVLGHYTGNPALSAVRGTRTLSVYNPATGEITRRVACADTTQVGEIVDHAERAAREWAKQPALRRARVLFRFKSLLEQHSDELASIITSEHGKVLDDARGEITRGIEVVEFACGIPQMLKGEYSDSVGSGIDSWSLRQPLGVCVGITPFNFPVMVPLWMAPVAIACGNAFILKPSEKTPSCALRLAELLADAGLPAGVFSVINGDREAVEALLEHPRVRAISFVGSTPVAERIYSEGTRRGKRVQALGGAKNHMVVMPDADVELAAGALMGAAYGSAGERCMAISVAVAVGDAGDRLIDALTPKLAALRVGAGDVTGQEMGPLVSREHCDKVRGYIELGIEEGARLLVDGRAPITPLPAAGYFLGPSLFDHVTPEMRIYREEIFGPVLAVVRVATLAQALELIAAHEFGNGTAIFTNDGGAARTFSHSVQAGMVGINVPIPVPMAFHSFGGWKRSLFGDLHMHGPDGVRFYTQLKTVTARWQASAVAEFSMPTLK